MTELTEDRIKQIRHIPSKSKYQWDILIECYDLKEADSFRQQILQALSLEKRVRGRIKYYNELYDHNQRTIQNFSKDRTVPTQLFDIANEFRLIIQELQQLLGDKHE